MDSLTNQQISTLKSMAQRLEPMLKVGKAGLSDGFVKTVDEALALHEQVVAADPKLDQAWVNLISLYARSNQPVKAGQAYRRAIALAPNRADAYYNFGVLCFGAERFDEAGRAFRACGNA